VVGIFGLFVERVLAGRAGGGATELSLFGADRSSFWKELTFDLN
jgi:hypothetical protein